MLFYKIFTVLNISVKYIFTSVHSCRKQLFCKRIIALHQEENDAMLTCLESDTDQGWSYLNHSKYHSKSSSKTIP